MLRSVTVGFASSVLVAACALVTEPPPPGGTEMIRVQVRNASDEPLGELGVKVRGGVLPSSAEPPWVPPDSTTMVTLHVPIRDEWWLAVNGIGVVVGQRVRNECVEFSTSTAVTLGGCDRR